MAYKKLALALMVSFMCVPLFGQSSGFPKIMYVNSPDGLRQRSEPSLNSVRIGTLLHGERITLYEKSAVTETIDGITDYWYRTHGVFFNGKDYHYSWVFGGYLSNTLPPDLPAIIGVWDEENKPQQYYYFGADKSYWEGYKETDMGYGGTWALRGNSLKITFTHRGDGETVDDTAYVELKIINRDTIHLIWPNKEVSILKRNNGVN